MIRGEAMDARVRAEPKRRPVARGARRDGILERCWGEVVMQWNVQCCSDGYESARRSKLGVSLG